MAVSDLTAARPQWMDKFNVPAIEGLMGAVSPDHAFATRKMRDSIRARRGVREKLSWMGIPWRWTLVYRARGSRAGVVLPLAFLILDPGAPRLCVPLTSAQVCELEVARLSRAQQDAILGGTKVGPQLWAMFQIGRDLDPGDVGEFLDLKTQDSSAEPASGR